MSLLLDRLNFLARKNADTFSEGHGVTTVENRDWEDAYRKRWQHDKIVRSTHGVNCTGSCSWKIYVKGGIITGRPSRPIIRGPALICPIMSHAAARVVQATAGIFIRPIA